MDVIERGVTAHGLASIPYSRWMSTVAARSSTVKSSANLELQLVVPLKLKRRGADDHDAPDAAPGQQLSQHQTGFDRLAEPDVVSEQERYSWHLQRLQDRIQLVRLGRDGALPRGDERGAVSG